MFDLYKLYSGFDALTNDEYEELMEEMAINNMEDDIAAAFDQLVNDQLDQWVREQPTEYWEAAEGD